MPEIEIPEDFLASQRSWYDQWRTSLVPEIQIRFGQLLDHAEGLREKAWMYDELCD